MARPHRVRLHQQSERQPQSRPFGLWSRWTIRVLLFAGAASRSACRRQERRAERSSRTAKIALRRSASNSGGSTSLPCLPRADHCGCFDGCRRPPGRQRGDQPIRVVGSDLAPAEPKHATTVPTSCWKGTPWQLRPGTVKRSREVDPHDRPRPPNAVRRTDSSRRDAAERPVGSRISWPASRHETEWAITTSHPPIAPTGPPPARAASPSATFCNPHEASSA